MDKTEKRDKAESSERNREKKFEVVLSIYSFNATHAMSSQSCFLLEPFVGSRWHLAGTLGISSDTLC